MLRFKTSPRKFSFFLILLSAAAASISWTTGTIVHSSGLNYDLYAADTIPEKSQSLENQIRQLEKAHQKLQSELNQKNWDKIEAEMENAINRINTKEIEAQLQKSMAELDRSMDKIEKEQLLRNLDMAKVQADLARTKEQLEKEFSKRDWQKELNLAQEEAQKALKEINKIDQKKLQEELERAKSEMKRNQESMALELEKAKKEMQLNKGMIRKSLDEASKELDNTRREYEGYRTMIGEMKKEGLITDPKNFRIEYKDGELKINDKKQPTKVTDRYRKYFHGKSILLKNENDQFDIEKLEGEHSPIALV